MSRGFRRSRRGIRAKLDEYEQGLLAHLFGEVHDLLEDPVDQPASDPLAAMVGIGTAVEAPSDPALARLLPDGHRDDPEASAEFRRYTEVGLRARKRAWLTTAKETLGREGELVVSDDEARAWLVALNDVRLVMAERMGVRTDEDHERLVARLRAAPPDAEAESPPGDGEADEREALEVMLSLYDFLAWLQETLVEAVSAGLPDAPQR